MKIETVVLNWTEPAPKRLHEILGNEYAKRAIEVALSGGHEIVFLALTRAPASDLLRATAQIAHENNWPFKGSVVPVCPCGAYGSVTEECRCSVTDLKQYARKVVPLFKRAAIVIETVEPSANDQRRGIQGNEHEARLVERVRVNHHKTVPASGLSSESEDLLRLAKTELKADKERAVAVASTIARMNDSGIIRHQHIAEAIQYQHRHFANWVDDFEEAS